MIFSYIKTSLRVLLNKRVFAFINIAGLALGMAASLGLFYYVGYEFSYNKSFVNSERSSRLYLERDQAGQIKTYFYLATALKNSLNNISEIDEFFRLINIDYQNNSLIHKNELDKKTFQQKGVYYSDASISDFLGLEMIEGSFRQMDHPLKMILSKKVADRFFGPGKAKGQRLSVSGNLGIQEYEVVGVMEDLPSNTHFDFEVLLSMPSLDVVEKGYSDSWDNWNAEFYIKTSAATQRVVNAIDSETADFFDQDKESKWHAQILPLEDTYLTAVEEDGTINRSAENTLWGLVTLGVFILFIAWINFINLSTAQAMERSREVGVRKTLGSSTGQLRIQFMTEALIINLVAAILAFTVVQVSLPLLSQITNPMIVPEEMKFQFWISVVTLLLCGSLISGAYPAFILSGFNPVLVLKGKMSRRAAGMSLRKTLVTLQFITSTGMIIATLIVYQQITFMKNKALGVNIDNIMTLDAPPGALNSDNGDFFQSVNSFKEEVSRLNFVHTMSASSYIPGQPIGWNSSIRRSEENDQISNNVMLISCDRDFLSTYGLELLAGRFYRDGDDTFGKGSFVINEEALKQFGFKNAEEAIGQKLTEDKIFPELTIIGVVKSFHQQSLKSRIEPCGFVLSIWSNYYSLALNIDEDLSGEQKAIQLKAGIHEVQKKWDEFFPDAPFDYSFLDQKFDIQYKSDQEFSTILGIFTLLALVIASSGLMGISAYTVAQRTKEIGIRKIMGASLHKIFLLLSQEYITLIITASIIAIPLAFYGAKHWLSFYPYRVEVVWWMIGLPVLFIVLAAIATISVHVLQAVNRNPINSLRYE
ncbi:FtsX-like permease family protein [Fulvivirga sp. M361]|uniref:ABC transporter permease n=1 Tax=Fulvivirga sp. M361 TaxID=2594266 RepID=UPI00117B5989|nr:ABC transporter permease [Fulvivirga sp. M361]TRX51767.1 FtsX-like permease family protein [Fulvivirga sp. M361]